MVCTRLVRLSILALLATPVAAFSQGPASTLYCCEDAQGRRVCSDLLPLECYGRAYRELGPRGVVRRHVPAPPTREEIARQKAEAQQREEEAARLEKQNLMDQILLETYTSLEDIDLREQQALLAFDRAAEGIRTGVEQLHEQRKRYQLESEFYAGRQLPREIVTGLQAIDAELAAIESAKEARTVEREAIRTRYAEDRARYSALLASGKARR